MTKRAKMGLYSGAFQFRVSKPSIDVDSAADDQFLVHETMLQAQIAFVAYVPKTAGTVIQTTTVAIPNLGYVPRVLFWIGSSLGLVYPSGWNWQAVGGDILPAPYFPSPNAFLDVFQTTVDVTMLEFCNGVYLHVLRIPA